jgi:hypothetical protein
VNIPKSKTFVRELTTNNNAGNKSQQPVEAATTPSTTLEPQPSKKGRSKTIIKISYHNKSDHNSHHNAECRIHPLSSELSFDYVYTFTTFFFLLLLLFYVVSKFKLIF